MVTNDGIEVQGRALQWTVAGFKLVPSMGLKFLERFGLTKKGLDGKPMLDVKAWYPVDSWLRCFAALETEVGAGVMFEIGKQLGGNAEYPMPVSDIETGVKLLDPGYHFYHRKNAQLMFDPTTGRMLDGIGHYGYQPDVARRILSSCDNPYPCAFDHGLLLGVALRFQPRARVTHDPPMPCRTKGHDRCRYVVTW